MKKIGIDARLYSQTGVGVYLQNLIYWLQKTAPSDLIFNIYLMKKDFNQITFSSKNFNKVQANYSWHGLGEQIGFAKRLFDDQLDLVHFTYFSYPILYKRKFVATIHDLTPLLFKTGKASSKNPMIYQAKYFFFKKILSSQIRNAAAIITPTDTIKQQIIKYFGQEYQHEISSIYEGISHYLLSATENLSLRKIFNTDFFIYVGNFYPHKNVERLIKAFNGIDDPVKLILIGPNDFFAKKLTQLINQLSLEKKIVFYHNPSYGDLIFFYKNAKALIHPSFAEGFGLPLVEAAYFGLPIIASNIEVFQEILNNDYMTFDPYSIDDIKNKINLSFSREFRPHYQNVLSKYSFEKMTRETLKIYLKLI